MHFATRMRTWRAARLYSVQCTVQWYSSVSETVRSGTHVDIHFFAQNDLYYDLPEYWPFLQGHSLDSKGFWRWCRAQQNYWVFLVLGRRNTTFRKLEICFRPQVKGVPLERANISKWTNWVGVFSPLHLMTETYPVSDTSFFVTFWV
jgi:hypothetical protein